MSASALGFPQNNQSFKKEYEFIYIALFRIMLFEVKFFAEI